MRKVIPYVDIPHGPNGNPGTWQRLETPSGRSASLVCPVCGEKGTLVNHQIRPGGEVAPVVICECGWQEWVRLERWNDQNA